MSLFFSYLKQQLKYILLFLLFSITFAITFFFYNFPLEALTYPTLLCVCFGLFFFIWDFSKTKALHTRLMELSNLTELSVDMIRALPQSDSIENTDYQLLLSGLAEQISDLKTAQSTRLTDMIDYYTVWVHQIKTPIAASRLLVAEVSDREVKQQLEQEIFKIDSYANLVLQYLRLESFHDDLVLKRVSVEDMVKEVVRKYALFFIQKNLTVDLHDLEQEVITDRKWLLVIIEQLLSNSLKYTSTGGIEIYFKDQTLYIKDSGIGIKNSDVLRVFERGFSGYNGHLTQQSSGLGLYLSKKIAEQLGHRITLHSEVGQGTTVAIRFEEKKLVMD